MRYEYLDRFYNVQKYLYKGWHLLKDKLNYEESLADNKPYEYVFKTKKTPTFPYNLKQIAKVEGTKVFKTTPFGNDMVLDFSLAAIRSDYSLQMIEKGYDPKQNGDLVVLLEPACMEHEFIGTTHGSVTIMIHMYLVCGLDGILSTEKLLNDMLLQKYPLPYRNLFILHFQTVAEFMF